MLMAKKIALFSNTREAIAGRAFLIGFVAGISVLVFLLLVARFG